MNMGRGRYSSLGLMHLYAMVIHLNIIAVSSLIQLFLLAVTIFPYGFYQKIKKKHKNNIRISKFEIILNYESTFNFY